MGRRLFVTRWLTCACVSLAVLIMTGCARSDDSLKTITPEGFDGVRAGMTVAEVEDEWGSLTVLFPADHASGASIASAPHCDGAVRAVAGFWAFPPVDEMDAWKQGELSWLWFFSGVQTAEDVRVGSPTGEVQDAYRDRLRRVLVDEAQTLDEGAPGYMESVFEVAGGNGKTSLLFGIRNGRVVAIGHALRAERSRLFDGLDVLDVRC
jgi:hypothetical protein